MKGFPILFLSPIMDMKKNRVSKWTPKYKKESQSVFIHINVTDS